jgi:hypothetical protein
MREREPPAAAHRVPVDHRDRRLLEILEQRVGALEQPPELALALAEDLAALGFGHALPDRRVRARREHGRRAGDDDDTALRVVAQLGEGRRELREHRIRERVAAVGTVQRDGDDRTFACERDVLTHDADCHMRDPD